jgi:hypothetical protein
MQDCGLNLTDRTEHYRASEETEKDHFMDQKIAPYPLEIEINELIEPVQVAASPNLFVSAFVSFLLGFHNYR